MCEKVVGIYCYRDTKNNDEIVYIGKDSNIDKQMRHKHHTTPSTYNTQPINRILQNNPDRYEYKVLKQFNLEEYNKKLLNALEIIYIKRYQPKFNFTIGGEGLLGFKHSEKTKQKIRESNLGKKRSKETKRKISDSKRGENHPNYNKHLSEETKTKISKANTGKKRSEETKQKLREINIGKKHSEETKKKMSESRKGRKHSEETKKKMRNKYAKILKSGEFKGKQNYCIYKDGKVIKRSIYPSKLLEWFTKEYPKEILEIKIKGDVTQ